MRLFIAEKPALAQAIYEGLGGAANEKMRDGFYSIRDIKITSCFGHMLELFDPEDYDQKFKDWNFENLPIKAVYPPKLKPKPQSKERLDVIIKLIQEADEIVNAGDIDEQGQYLIDEILTYVDNKKPVLRVLISDMNLKPVQKALGDLRPNEEFIHWTNSALAQSIGDQLFGYNLTRAYTIKAQENGFDGVLNVGRVQSATLGLINSRTIANLNHIDSSYYDISTSFKTKLGSFKAKYIPKETDLIDEKNRIIDQECANAIIDNVSKKTPKITSINNTNEKKAAPLPYNLSALQQTCAKKYGYTSEETLNIAQSLYEKHKLLTYPRTDSRYLSDEHLSLKYSILAAISATQPDLIPAISNCEDLKHKAFDTSKFEAHHAICPTEKSGNGITLSHKEKVIYDLVANSFVALFYPESIRQKTKLNIEASDYEFSATQSVLKLQGWEQLFKGDIELDASIEGLDFRELSKDLDLIHVESHIDKKKTKPPKYFVESTLLAAMTKAAKFVSDPELRKALIAKDEGNASESGSIGTEATRAGILAKLTENTNILTVTDEKGYKEKVWKTTTNGQEFCSILPKEITAPDTSALWAQRKETIKRGGMSVKQFIDHLEIYLGERIHHLKTSPLNISSNMEKCPNCNDGRLRRMKGEKGYYFACNTYPACKSTFPASNGKPNLIPKQKLVVSTVHKCPVCKLGLSRIRKKKLNSKRKPMFFWGCSGYPDCNEVFNEKAGLPVIAK